jgi:hypothetical protein
VPLVNGFAALPDFGLSELFFLVIKIIAVIGGGLVGWFVTKPVVRLLVKLAFHRETPAPALTVSRILGAILVACIVYKVWNFGPGGGGPGPGPGPGGKDKGASRDVKPSDPKKDQPARDSKPKPAPTEVVPIKLLGGSAVRDERFYLIKGQEPALPLAKVEEYVQNNRDRLKGIEIIIDADSVSRSHIAVTRLMKLAEKYKLSVTLPPAGNP